MHTRFKSIAFFLFLTLSHFCNIAHSQDNLQTLRGGWYPWEPYQYEITKGDSKSLTGLDVGLLRALFERMGYRLNIESVSWSKHQQDLKAGSRDIASGAFKNDDRNGYVFYSDPYRVEKDVMYMRTQDKEKFTYENPSELIDILTSGPYRIGVIDGFYYGPTLKKFIDNPANSSKVIKVNSDLKNFKNLISGKIDLFPVDHLVGTTLSWKNGWQSQVMQSPVPFFEAPVHVIFSKKTIDIELVKHFNQTLEEMKSDGQYNAEVRKYLLPALLGRTTGQPWFFIIDIVGTIAFAISGILLAREGSYSLFGALVLASLPSVGGGVVRDLLVNRDTLAILRSPVYLLTILATVLFFFLLFKIAKLTSSEQVSPNPTDKVFFGKGTSRVAIEFFDALGLSLFAVVGVLVAVETNAQPLWLWGPVLAALTGAGGGILRDVFRADPNNPGLKGVFYAEVAIIWGLFLSLFLEWYSFQPRFEPAYLTVAVLVTILGGLLTRMLAVHYKIRSPMI